MRRFRDYSIRTKLNVLVGIAAAVALVLACIAFVVNDVITFQASTVHHISAIAEVVGANTVAPITFEDRVVAKDILSSLRHESNIRFACVYDGAGQPFAVYEAEGQPAWTPPPVEKEGHRFASRGVLEVFSTISDAEELIGTLYVEAGMEHIAAHAIENLMLAAGVLIVALLISLGISSKLQNVVSLPVVELAETAKRISHSHDYSVRVQHEGNDEIGTLYQEFNAMLAEIDQNRQQLREARNDLERRVEQRTQELSEAVENLQFENAERCRVETDLRTLQVQHIAAARRIGMAEVATSVLHNVGNVLNSVNVSASLISDCIRKIGVADYQRAMGILEKHLPDLGAYVTEDPRGKHLPRFLIELGGQMASSEIVIQEELGSLLKNIDHIKDIVSVQQSHAGASGLLEEVALSELIDDAIRINTASVSRHQVLLVREIEELPSVMVDKHKLLQILVNLISNAKYATIESGNPEKIITVKANRVDDTRVRITVSDTGVGILSENLTRIFSHGFTTRKEGHGFGLHSAAIAANDLRGALSVHSDGAGLGATFVLEIPCLTPEAVPAHAH